MIELIVVLVIVGTVAGLAAPEMRGSIARYRVHGALNRVVAEIQRARMVAVESGSSAQVVLHTGPGGCVERIGVVAAASAVETSISAAVVLPGLCMRSSGDSVLVFNSRGMLRPPARSIRVSHGTAADSVVLSVSGRVRRTY
jgi:Tfp pilus assembly protein FimT